jgi:thioesterase III
MKYPTEIIVRGYHLDFYGHVNNARYLEFLEEARWDYYGDEIFSGFFKKNELSFVVVNININYRRIATLNQHLILETSVKKVSTRSITLYQKIFLKDDNTLISDADVTFVMLDKTGKVVRIDGELKEIFVK